MKFKKAIAGLVLAVSLVSFKNSFAHCQVPCGIYNDELRIHQIEEYILTIEKSMNAIKSLSGNLKDPLTLNQVVRWIDNKDKHAEKIQKIIWEYFFTQRVKPVDPKNKKAYERYLKLLELLNKMSFYSMKAKQSVDPEVTKKLRETLEEFEKLYFGKDHHHKH
jgi:nickel superoxide dismutase